MRFAILGISPRDQHLLAASRPTTRQFEASDILRGEEMVARVRRRALPRSPATSRRPTSSASRPCR